MGSNQQDTKLTYCQLFPQELSQNSNDNTNTRLQENTFEYVTLYHHSCWFSRFLFFKQKLIHCVRMVTRSASLFYALLCLKPSWAEAEIFWEKLVNANTVDALVPCVTRPAAAPRVRISNACTMSLLRNDRNHKDTFMFPENNPACSHCRGYSPWVPLTQLLLTWFNSLAPGIFQSNFR